MTDIITQTATAAQGNNPARPAINADLKQKINSIGRLERNEGATMFFIIEKSEEKTFKFKKNSAAVV